MAKEKTKMGKTPIKGPGPPTKFKKEYVKQAFALALLGAEYKDLPEIWGISPKTLKLWEVTHPGINSAFSSGKTMALADVSLAVYRRACGYSHKATKIFCSDKGGVTKVPYTERYPPDPKSAELILTSERNPKRWNRRVDVKHDVSEGLAARLAAARKRAVKKPENKKGEGG